MQYNFIINFFFIFTLNGHIKKLKSKFTSDYIICLQFFVKYQKQGVCVKSSAFS